MQKYTFEEKIKILLQKKGIKRSYVAQKLNISYNTLTNKLNGNGYFNIIQMSELMNILELSNEDAIQLCFNPNFDINKLLD